MTRKQLNERLVLINPQLKLIGNLVKFNDGSSAGTTVFDLKKWCCEDQSLLSKEELEKLGMLLKKYFVELFGNLK